MPRFRSICIHTAREILIKRYRKLKASLPPFLRYGLKYLRLSKPITKLLGPRHRPNHNMIEIDITYSCNLKCINCNRSCRQAPSDECMSVFQIEKFIKESVDKRRKWERIRILGGEPTLHPDIFEILKLFLAYKRKFSNATLLCLVTNGHGSSVNEVLSKIPKDIAIENTHKAAPIQRFKNFNSAPIDTFLYKFLDYSNGCGQPFFCGIGLTRFGYYPCGVGGGIDRIIAFDIGRKTLPSVNDSMIDQLRILCKYCGFFRIKTWKLTREQRMSTTWEKLYKGYKNRKGLTLY